MCVCVCLNSDSNWRRTIQKTCKLQRITCRVALCCLQCSMQQLRKISDRLNEPRENLEVANGPGRCMAIFQGDGNWYRCVAAVECWGEEGSNSPADHSFSSLLHKTSEKQKMFLKNAFLFNFLPFCV